MGCVSAALLVVGVLAPASSPAAEPGVVLPGPETSRTPELKSLGTHWVRMFVTWPDVEPARESFAQNWLSAYEQMFNSAPAGTKVLLDVVDSPSWETGSPSQQAPPANPEDYAAMMGMLARRFAGKVAAYEIWNEEDQSSWWTGAPNPAAYAQLLKATYPVVKAADPGATVLVGGLTGNDYPFLEGLYAAGAKGSFDAVAVHTDTACNVLSPYDFLRGADEKMIPDSFLAYREVHKVMVDNGDEKPIWMTELSWRTTPGLCTEGAWAGQKPAGVSESDQATFLSQAYHCLAQDPYVKVALWFPLVDQGLVQSGLIRANGTRKPSFDAMRSYAHNGDSLTEPCGVTTGPRISIASPANGTSYSGPLPIHVSASSSIGVFRIRMEIDGKLIRNYDGSSYPDYLSGSIEWQGAKHIPFGTHVLTFLAYDKERNVSQTSITIYHAKPGGKARRHAKRHGKRHLGRHHH